MKKKDRSPYQIRSISELHRLFALSKPDHSLVSVIDFALLSYKHSDVWKHFTNDFYCIAIKTGAKGKFRYGQQDYDFEEGIMTFTKPGQVFSVRETDGDPVTGYLLVFKPELIQHYPLAKRIKEYGFFSYAVAEALHLSDKEKEIIYSLLRQMQQELKNSIDQYSQDVIVSHVELLLSYSNRFYNRQFITRKAVHHDLLSKLEQILKAYFENEEGAVARLPSVKLLADELNLSANYLSDMLRSLTGQSVLQYIHSYIIEEAKTLLSTTNLNISEIAYRFGFQYPQSFNKLFKKKTDQTPLQYRQSYY
jgi:AraC family transcriptional activator of pobA